MGTRQLYPSEIRFSSDYILNKFADGRDVNVVAESICEGKINVGEIPIIQIVKRDGKYYTLDNRRLYVFRVGQFKKCIGKIPTLLFKEDRLHPEKHTTTNDGRYIVVKDGITLPHIKDNWLKNTQTSTKVQSKSTNGSLSKAVANGNSKPKVDDQVALDMPEHNEDNQVSPSSWWACSLL